MLTQRKSYIDIAKGVGILLVVFGHCVPNSPIVPWQCSFFMALFFLCSGLCYKSPKSFSANAKKTLPAYYFWGGVGLLMELALLLLQKDFSLMQMLERTIKFSLGMNMWNYPLWFLVAFFVSKCVFDGIFVASQRTKHPSIALAVLAVICFALGLVLAQVKQRLGEFFPFRMDIGFTMVLFLYVGYASRRVVERTETMQWGIKAFLALVFFAVNYLTFRANTLVSVNSSDYGNPVWFFLSSVSGTYFVLLLAQLVARIKPVEKVLSWFGTQSMTMMCTHALALTFIAKALVVLKGYLHFSNTMLDIGKFLLCTACTALICVAVTMWKKRKTKKSLEQL